MTDLRHVTIFLRQGCQYNPAFEKDKRKNQAVLACANENGIARTFAFYLFT